MRELLIVVKDFFVTLWHSILGVFLYARRLGNIRRKAQEQDEKLFFKEKSKKMMYKWVVEERKRLNLAAAKLPKKQQDNAVIYNYFCTVLLQHDPNDTVEDTLHKFYTLIHPYIYTYLNSHRKLQAIVANDKPELVLRNSLHQIRKSMKNVTDLGQRAEHVLNIKQNVVKEVRELEKKYNRRKKMVAEKFDKEMYEIDKAIAEKQKKEAEKKLENFKKMEQEDEKRSRKERASK